jgi:hypothetical protein
VSAPRVPPGVVLDRLREARRKDPNVVRVWWKDDQVLVALSDVGGELDDYRAYIQELAASVLPIVRQHGSSFACGPLHEVAAAAGGGSLVYDRDPR